MEKSEAMARVRQGRTNIEDRVACACRALGLHYRRNVANLPGRPDLANKSRRWAIFVNGCFWHHHKNCTLAKLPATNSDFWREKLRANRLRDARTARRLRSAGYRVMIVWGCKVRDERKLLTRLSKMAVLIGVRTAEPIDH